MTIALVALTGFFMGACDFFENYEPGSGETPVTIPPGTTPPDTPPETPPEIPPGIPDEPPPGIPVSTPDSDEILSIAFTQIADEAPSIAGPVLYRVSNGGPTSATITVENPGQYNGISWLVQNTSVTGTGPSFTLSAANTAYDLIGEYFLSVMVMKSGVPFSKTVSFRVEY